MKKQFSNVREQVMLYDTIGIWTIPAGTSYVKPDGWVISFAALGALNSLNFFNVRNKSVGLMWNNQEKRDQLDWAFLIESIGLEFRACPITNFYGWTVDPAFFPDDYTSHVFMNDLPRHIGVKFRIQQDDRLKTHALFCSPGYGIFGDGYGRGSPSGWSTLTNSNAYDHHLSINNQGLAQLDNRYPFPIPLEVPRNSSLQVSLEINEYGRNLLAAMPTFPHGWGQVDGVDDMKIVEPFAYIRCSLVGKREVQQRGQYHR